MLSLKAHAVTFPIRGHFTIARGSLTDVTLIEITLSDGQYHGRGEARPYARHHETAESVLKQLQSLSLWDDITAANLCDMLPAGAARNALDCALWDLRAKQSGKPVWQLLSIPKPPTTSLTAYTISLDSPAKMATQAKEHLNFPLLKLKLGGGEQDAERLNAIRAARPDARLIVDANEGWTLAQLNQMHPVCVTNRVELIEQPLPQSDEQALRAYRGTIPLCADESCRTLADLTACRGLYSAISIKLDKAGGLTSALALAKAAQAQNFNILLSCMLSSSLSIAAAQTLAGFADWVDLDAPLLLAQDRDTPIRYDGAHLYAATPALWG